MATVSLSGVGDVRACETCNQSHAWLPYPQCASCLRHRAKPADDVPLMAETIPALQAKRHRWEGLHPCWRLVLAAEWVAYARPSKSSPMGRRLFASRYLVRRR